MSGYPEGGISCGWNKVSDIVPATEIGGPGEPSRGSKPLELKLVDGSIHKGFYHATAYWDSKKGDDGLEYCIDPEKHKDHTWYLGELFGEWKESDSPVIEWRFI